MLKMQGTRTLYAISNRPNSMLRTSWSMMIWPESRISGASLPGFSMPYTPPQGFDDSSRLRGFVNAIMETSRGRRGAGFQYIAWGRLLWIRPFLSLTMTDQSLVGSFMSLDAKALMSVFNWKIVLPAANMSPYLERVILPSSRI